MINVTELRYTYPNAKQQTLKGMDFSVAKGEIFGFLGPSGAGKSTAQKILTGILKGYSGRVSVLGSDVRSKKREYYERIGVAMEIPNLYGKFTAIENLNFFAALYNAACDDAVKLMERLELGDDINTRVSGFSKGMKIRLNFIRAIQHRPDVLFLDEPTAGLDPARARIIKDMVLEQKAAGRTVLLTTHNMHLAEELCDRVAFIVDGTIRLMDTPMNLRLRAGERRVRYTWHEKTRKEKVVPLKDLNVDTQFIKLLKESRLETLHTLEPSLDELFIEVTGRRLV